MTMNPSQMPYRPAGAGSLFSFTGDLRADIRQLLGEDSLEPRPALQRSLRGHFARILGIATQMQEHTENETDKDDLHSLEDLLTGLHAQNSQCAYVILSRENTVRVHFGLSSEEGGGLADVLPAVFPGICVAGSTGDSLAEDLGGLRYCAAMRGVPSTASRSAGIDRLFRVLSSRRLAYVVLAQPVAPEAVAATLESLSLEMQRVKNTYLRASTAESNNNPLGQYYLDLLEAAFEQYKAGRVKGCWDAKGFLLADSGDALASGMAILTSIFCGGKSLPSPFQLYPCPEQRPSAARPTVLNTPQLSLLMRLPREEAPGYQVKPLARFASALPETSIRKPIAIGKVLRRGSPTGQWLEAGIDDLTRHVLCTGTTGSGKTETCHWLLDQLWAQNRIPYLVIEPAKREYRSLRRVAGHEDLRVLTLGDDAGNSLRLNPFELIPGTPVQSHLDFLLMLFKACFQGLYAPMPYLIEEGLYRAYERAGWDMASGQDASGSRFPDLTDFCREIDRVVEESGYDEDTRGNVGSALRVRLNSLRRGTKGRTLNAPASTPLMEIMSHPTVIEMASVADEETVAFTMGLLLVGVYEYLQYCAGPQTATGHVTLIEESHRVFQANLQGQGDIENSHMRGKAVEVLANMLAEVRAYGEGFIIVDQSPTKIHSEAIKNTNLKITHRLVAEEDRKAIAGSTTMNQAQATSLATLETGQAIVYAEGLPQPYMVSMPAFRRYRLPDAAGVGREQSTREGGRV